MINVISVSIRNFLSIGNVFQTIKLDTHGLTLLLGSNSDTQGNITKNGAGKSAALQAICYGLYGNPLTQIKKDNLINNINGKGMLVAIDFERDGKKYHIERGRKPNILRFMVNDTEISSETDETQGENRHTQAEIERAFGMGYLMFKHLVALNTFTDPFLRMKAADQREVIEELLGVTQISHRAEILKKLISDTKERIRDQEALIRATTEANSRIETTINQTIKLSNTWSIAHEQSIEKLNAELEAVNQIDFDKELAIFDAIETYDKEKQKLEIDIDNEENEIKSLQREISFLKKTLESITEDSSIIGHLEDRKTRLISDQKRMEINFSRETADLQKLENALVKAKDASEKAINHLSHAEDENCITCGQSLIGTEHLTTVKHNLEKEIANANKKISDLENDIAELTARLDTSNDSIKVIENEIIRLTNEIVNTKIIEEEQKTSAEKKKNDIHNNIYIFETKIALHIENKEKLLKAIVALNDRPQSIFENREILYQTKSMRDLLSRDLEAEIVKENPYQMQIENLKSTIMVIDYEPLNDANLLLKHQDFLLRILTNKDSFIRKKIIDQNLVYLNTRLNGYLDKLGLPHEVRFQSDLSVEIDLLGREYDFDQLSRGEMNRVILSTSFAFRDVWESLNTPINILFIDELLDSGLCDIAAENALNILKGMSRERGKNIFLISHKDQLVSRVSNVITVSKENGFTTYEEM